MKPADTGKKALSSSVRYRTSKVIFPADGRIHGIRAGVYFRLSGIPVPDGSRHLRDAGCQRELVE
jgi:hypothetical protein